GQDIPIQITGSINSIQTGKYEVNIPSKSWSKVESKRIKRGYTKRATLDCKEWRTFNCAPQDIANYRNLVTTICEDYSISTKLFTSSCPWAYFLLGKGPIESINDIFPSEGYD
ncbi:hypothetical protein LRR18_17320, partial [Mangrovimonas sp. AS39]|uniref:hypothetical protein n=1 Tax=Mangrovimonas futianensis TaxID=2895523 RepID=UPI001E2DF544